MAKKFKIKKGDTVVAIAGKDKGKTGEVVRVLRKEDRLLVQGINMVRRHQRPSQLSPGGSIDKEASIHISNVAHVDPKTDLPTRVGYKTIEGDRKVVVHEDPEALRSGALFGAFDLAVDPGEREDVRERATWPEELRRRLAPGAARLLVPRVAAGRAELSAEDLAELRAMGYAGGE